MSRVQKKVVLAGLVLTAILIGIFAPRSRPILDSDLVATFAIPTTPISHEEKDEDDDSTPELNPDERVTVKGRVLGSDGKPVIGTKLFVQTKEMFVPVPEIVMCDDGTFTFNIGMNDRSDFHVVATAPNHGIAWDSLYPRPLEEIELRLTPEEPIRGTLLDPEGKPASGVTISVSEVSCARPGKSFDKWLEITRDPKIEKERDNLEYFRGPRNGFSDVIAPVISDHDGKFENRGIGRDHIADLLISAPTIAPIRTDVITRKIESFTARVKGIGEIYEETYHGSECVLKTTPVPLTTGRVIDKASGKPIPGTMLWVQGRGQGPGTQGWIKTQVVTDKEGKFTLPGLKLDDKEGKIQIVPPEDAPYHRLEIKVPDGAAERGNFEIKLTRGIPATVKVIDKLTKKPVIANLDYNVFTDENANIKDVPDYWHQRGWYVKRSDYETDASEFKIVVFPGKGLLTVKADWKGDYLKGIGLEKFEKRKVDGIWLGPYGDIPRLTGLAGGVWNDLPVRNYNRFEAIDVPEDAKEFSITLELDPGLSVAGQLVDTEGKPVTGCKAYGLSPRSLGWDWTNPLKQSEFTVSVMRPDEKRRVLFVHNKRKLAGTALVTAGMEGPIRVQLEPWGEVVGQLVNKDGTPAGDTSRSSLNVGGDPEDMIPEKGYDRFWFPIHRGTIGADGHFRIVGLIPGLPYQFKRDDGMIRHSFTTDIGKVTPASGKTINLGKVAPRY